ncbi:hypothetical protein BY996DRAFT_6615150, partial [Phakopsora pachyrhizi]
MQLPTPKLQDCYPVNQELFRLNLHRLWALQMNRKWFWNTGVRIKSASILFVSASFQPPGTQLLVKQLPPDADSSTVDRYLPDNLYGTKLPYIIGGEQHQATFTAAQTAPQAAFVSASVASASLSSLTSLALPSSSPTSLQNGSSNDSFPKWEIVLIAAAIECANYNANNLQPSISPSMNTPASRLLSASGMSNNKRERLGFLLVEVVAPPIVITLWPFLQPHSLMTRALVRRVRPLHIEMTKSLVESLSFHILAHSSAELLLV